MSVSLIILLITFFVLIVASVPISFAIGIASLASLLYSGIPLLALAQRIFAAVDSFTLLAVPYFILCGDLMLKGGISKRIIEFVKCLVGWMKGGLSYVTILASAFFGAISGSSLATTNTIGGALYPEMTESGYKPAFAAAVGSVGGTLGILIPPSIAFVLFGTQTGTSVTSLFLVGVTTGILFAALYMLAARTELAVTHIEVKRTKRPNLHEVVKSGKSAFWGLLTPIIILGGIYSGVTTATEAAVLAVVYSIIIGIFVYRELTLKDIYSIFIKSASSAAALLFLVSVASLFSWVTTYEGLASVLNNLVSAAGLNRITFLLICNVIYLVLGMMMDTIPIIILTAPIFYPIAMGLGVDPVHFGAITVGNLAFGLFTPPFGVCVFMASSYSKQGTMEIFKNCRLFFLFGAIGIILITYFPDIIMWIVN